MASSDRIDIAASTNKFIEVNHAWKGQQKFEGGQSTVRTMSDPLDNTLNAASTEWVNNFFEGKIPTTPTINLPLLTPIWFDHTCDSTAWVKSEYNRTVSNPCWLSQKAYDTIYTHLILDVNGKSAVDEKIGNITIHSVVTANDGHKIILSSVDDGDDNALFNSCGVAWYYVLDTTNKRFKLPRTRFGFQGLKSRGSVGKYDAPGLPNITGKTSGCNGYDLFDGAEDAHSALYPSNWSKPTIPNSYIVATGEKWDDYNDLEFDASKSSSIYGSSSTVQPPATEMYLYFSTGDESAGGVGGGVGGGVIDGTLLKEKTIVTKTITSTAQHFYTVQNDCGLGIFENVHDQSNTTAYYFDEACTLPLYSHDESRERVVEGWGVIVNVKKGVTIYARLENCIQSASTVKQISFYEYALNSLAPQIAMPDYSATPTTVTNGWTATENGWIAFNLSGVALNTDGVCKINSNIVARTCQYSWTTSNTNQIHPGVITIVPVSKNDTIEISHTSITATFYPCKTVQQTNPPVYITERKHGLFADEFSTTTVYAVGDYCRVTSGGTVTYYRITTAGTGTAAAKTVVQESEVPTWCYTIYSDGYCEQNGRIFFTTYDSGNGNKIKFKKSFIDTTYVTNLLVSTGKVGGNVDWGNVINEYQWKRENSATFVYVNDTAQSPSYNHYINWEAKGYIY